MKLAFYLGKNIKSWEQICASVREARKKYTSICPSLPFDFNFGYDSKREKLRIYFLASINSLETTLYYCDVDLLKNSTTYTNEVLLDFIGDESDQADFPIDIEHKQPQQQQEQNPQLLQNSSSSSSSYYQQKTNNEVRSRSNSETNIDIADCDLDLDNNAR